MSKIVIKAPERKVQSIPNDDTELIKTQPALTEWHGVFTSSKLGPLILKGKIDAMARCPIHTTIPYKSKISIKYEGMYMKGAKVDVEALITPSGKMHVVVCSGNDKDAREIIFNADNRTLNEVTGRYEVVVGPMQDTGTFRLSKGPGGFLHKYI